MNQTETAQSTKTAADYAAIAVAPLLIFLMISSLANFLTLTLYHGAYPSRVAWILMMFTLGAVGIARVAIERDRVYSLGYAGILGLVTFVAMLRFVDSPLFVILILGLIAYLADVIIRDCTLIDESVDSSDQGLIDSGRLFVRTQIRSQQPSSEADDRQPPRRKPRQRHQPGRTVMYLALAALPLFGLGQFFLRNDAATWQRAQKLLAFYLFASLSLLVTTSFLGLRRYLRQRKVDMPGDVAVAWLAGGLVMIATVLMIAYMAPLPGQALASFELPIQLNSPEGTRASRFGWGQEGADEARPDAPRVSDPSRSGSPDSPTTQGGASPGNAAGGDRRQGPPGRQSGQGSQPSGQGSQSSGANNQGASRQSADGQRSSSQRSSSQRSSSQSSSSQSSSSQSPGKPDAGSGRSGNQPPASQGSSSKAAESSSPSSRQAVEREPSRTGSGQPTGDQSPKPPSSTENSSAGQASSPQSSERQPAGAPPSDPSASRPGADQSGNGGETRAGQDRGSAQDTPDSKSNSDNANTAREGDSSGDSAATEPQQSRDTETNSERSDQASRASASDRDPSVQEAPSSDSASWSQSLAAHGSILNTVIKLLVALALMGIVGVFLWSNWEQIQRWWAALFGSPKVSSGAKEDDLLKPDPSAPPRPFASFRNPIGQGLDERKVVVITFQALEAWAREHGASRRKEETPNEFLRRATKLSPQFSGPVSQIVDAYNRVVYGKGRPTPVDLQAAAQVWQVMQST